MPSSRVFTGITSEGGLLPTDFLAELTRPNSDIEGLDPTTYRLAPGERIGDQVNRSWNRLKGCWVNFLRSIASKQPGEPTTTETRERWLFPLFQELDFGRLTAARPIEIDGKSYPVSHGWGSVPIHLVGTHVDLDRRTPGAVGAAKASPHSLVQQVLNASDNHRWGIISNGFTLRLVRDNVALTRIAYLEWDLQAIFDGDLYPEFFLLWLVCHQSRFEPSPEGRSDQCWIEKWKKQAEDKGLRALENLRPGVEKAIASIGSGLVSHKANQTLRSKLSSGQLPTQEFYRQVLRIIYRMLFLFVAEDRGLLHPPLPEENAGKGAMERAFKARQRYRNFYSIGRLRDLTIHRAGTPHPDLWQVFHLISSYLGSDSGCPALALPALGSFLWSPESTPDLTDCQVSNRHFMDAIHALAFIRDDNVRRAIDYKNLGAEELGSVYESLLELHPLVNADAGTFELKTAAGHERKTTGSYYTPESLVQCLLDSALEPVIAETIKGMEGSPAADALLKLKICDPAVGSGHFLISAAHRLARRVAAARIGEEEPSPEATRSALREVIGRCLYGVDVNPMAAELCRVSLWLEALEPGKPLSFLDHHIRVGNSLLGATPELIAGGLPDEAFNPIEGDDKNFCSALKKQNKRERTGQASMFHMMVAESQAQYNSIESRTRVLDEAQDNTIEEIQRKAEQFHCLVVSPEYQHAQQVADTWCAAFVWRKQKGASLEPITSNTIRRLEEEPNALSATQRAEVEHLAQQYRFFHWHLAFSKVFAQGGFDCVLGNPPWDQLQFRLQEFFADKAPLIASASTEAIRAKMIAALSDTDPALFEKYLSEVRKNEGERLFAINSGRYPHSARGRVNSYLLFAELASQLSRHSIGLIVPSGVATDESGRLLFAHLFRSGRLQSLWDFENRERLFAEVDGRARFALITIGLASATEADFCFGLHNLDQAREQARHFRLSSNDLTLLNPNTLTCPSFISQRDSVLVLAIHRRLPILIAESTPPVLSDTWDLVTKPGLLNMATDSRLFVKQIDQAGFFPVYEGKMFSFFDHRFADVVLSVTAQLRQGQSEELSDAEHVDPTRTARPRHWIRSEEIEKRVRGQWDRGWIAGWKEITSPTNARTLIPSILPLAGIGHKIPVFLPALRVRNLGFALVTNLSAFVCDFVCRNKLNGTSLTPFTFKQLPALSPSLYEFDVAWASGNPLNRWVLPRALELIYTAWDLELFAQDCGWSGPPFRWDEERRFLLRCELDAAFFHLYLPATTNGQWKPASIAEGAVRDETSEELAELKRHLPTPRDAVAYIMDTFPIVRRKDEEKYGEYRTKRVILEIYDEMAEAMRTRKPYQTRLDPPPGPPADEHGDFLPLPEWKPGQPKPLNWPSHIHSPKETKEYSYSSANVSQ